MREEIYSCVGSNFEYVAYSDDDGWTKSNYLYWDSLKQSKKQSKITLEHFENNDDLFEVV